MTKNKKILSVTCLILAGIVLISGIITAIVLININKNSKSTAIKLFNRQLAKYEKLVNDTDTKKYTQSVALSNKNISYTNDYIMDIYIDDDTARIQMIQNDKGKLYLLKFNGLSFNEFGEYDGKQYVMQVSASGNYQYVYEIVKGKITTRYESTSAPFYTICNNLQKYLPNSYCGKGTYDSHKVYINSQNNDTTFILYGENTKLLFNKTYYFEETTDKFIKIKPSDVSYIFKIPNNIK